MAMSAGLLGTSIHEIQVSWVGPKELKQVNYALQSLPKGLKFLHAVPPSKSPKVMGLVGIHDPDALCHFSGITYCPWCRKEGMHYRLGLVCNRCHDCPSTMSDTLCHMASRTLANPGRMIPPSQCHLSNLQEKHNHLSWESRWNGLPRLPYQEYPCLPLQHWERTSGEGTPHQARQPITYSSTKLN